MMRILASRMLGVNDGVQVLQEVCSVLEASDSNFEDKVCTVIFKFGWNTTTEGGDGSVCNNMQITQYKRCPDSNSFNA